MDVGPLPRGSLVIHWLRDGVLGIVIILGAVSAWRSGMTRAELAKDEQRLTLLVGTFEERDPSQVHIRALPTNDPMHFAWRVQLPPKYPLRVESSFGDSSMGVVGIQRHFIARVRFRETPDGDLEFFSKFGSGSSLSTLGDPALAKLLHSRWQECIVEQLGAGETVSLKADEYATLLRITMSKELAADAKKQLDTWGQKRFVPQVFLWGLGNHPELHPKSRSLSQTASP